MARSASQADAYSFHPQIPLSGALRLLDSKALPLPHGTPCDSVPLWLVFGDKKLDGVGSGG